jgi:uroporphyrin-III C-methyltransferase
MFLPVALNLNGRMCLIAGGGAVAACQCRVLLEYGAQVRVVSLSFSDDPVWSDERVECIAAHYERKHLSGAELCVAATSDPALNRNICQDARAASAWALNTSAAEDCDWILPATLRRGAFTASFATDRVFPTMPAANAAPGKVFLVGAGPGDPGLITLKGAQCLRAATVVIHDSLANSELLDLFCSGAVRVDVSKRKGMCLHMQPEINRMLVDWARLGHIVVRLKGGDPMIFGRGGEEARALATAEIPFEVVPGVSSLSAVPAYAGIPVTDREFGSASIGVYSLHRRNGAGLTEEQWRGMANGAETLVLFMGMSLVADVVTKLLHYGRSKDEPIAIISQGTTEQQREIVATLGTILASEALRTAQSPGLIVIGNVVRAYGLLPWFHVQPSQPAPEPSSPTASDAAKPARAAAPALIHALLRSPLDGDAIEAQSLAAIDRQAPAHGFSPTEWDVVRRLIHTTADFTMIGLVRFSPGVIDAARRALLQGAPIFADSNMIRAGLSLARLRRMCPDYTGASIHCHVADTDVAAEARRHGLPRSLFAVRKAAPVLDGGIALFGNAPVALMELNRMILEEGIRPALVLAMPVGFVHVEESKQELMSLDVPWISIPGRRGGSTLAVAALHALCNLNGGSSQ